MPRSKAGVSFQVDDANDHGQITVVKSKKSARKLDVNVGFLKVYNRYSIQFTIPKDIKLCENITCSTFGLGIVVKQLIFKESGLLIFVEYTPELKEGVVTEKFELISETNECKKLTVVLHMEILGKDQGTPSLKTGVKCIEKCSDYDSEQSDWQGF